MFFENPVAAMRNMRRALRSGGRFTMIVWRRIEDNPWLGAAKAIALQHLPQPGADARTCGPGPFSMADEGVVSAQMTAAGYSDITFERVDAPVRMGHSIEDAIGFQLALGPAGEVYREAGDGAAAKHDALVADLTELLKPHVADDGVYMGSSSWVGVGPQPRVTPAQGLNRSPASRWRRRRRRAGSISRTGPGRGPARRSLGWRGRG